MGIEFKKQPLQKIKSPSLVSQPDITPSPTNRVDTLFHWQAIIGNRALQRMLQRETDATTKPVNILQTLKIDGKPIQRSPQKVVATQATKARKKVERNDDKGNSLIHGVSGREIADGEMVTIDDEKTFNSRLQTDDAPQSYRENDKVLWYGLLNEDPNMYMRGGTFRNAKEIDVANQMIDKAVSDTLIDGTTAQELKASLLQPFKINQGAFNFCGGNMFLMSIATKDPVGYINYVLDAHRAFKTGGGNAKIGNMTVPLDPTLLQTALTLGDNITRTDWMTMASLRKATTDATNLSPQELLEGQQILGELQSGKTPVDIVQQYGADKVKKAIATLQKTMGPATFTKTNAPNIQQGSLQDTMKLIAESTSNDEVVQWFKDYGVLETDIIQYGDVFSPQVQLGDFGTINGLLNGGAAVLIQLHPDTLYGNTWDKIAGYSPTKSHWVMLAGAFSSGKSGSGDDMHEATVNTWGGQRQMKVLDSQIMNSFYGYVAAKIPEPHNTSG